MGDDNAQTKETARNVELLRSVMEDVEKRKAATQQARERQLERLHAAQARVAATTRRRLTSGVSGGVGGGSAVAGSSAAGAAAAAEAERKVQEASRIGVKGHLDVDELVKFIESEGTGGGAKRSKNALRGKRRTGAKR